MRVAVNPDIRARVGDFVGKIGNESGIEAVSGSYNSYWYNKKRPRGRYRKAFFLMELSGAQGRNRTADTRIFSPLLYRLSYLGKSEPTL